MATVLYFPEVAVLGCEIFACGPHSQKFKILGTNGPFFLAEAKLKNTLKLVH